jgi:HAD superfamily hydrolase (TIGR01484 family)
MKPLDQLTWADAKRIRYVLTDIDDTVTTDGRLTATAYQALEALDQAGILVIPITGRPAGWCDHIARMWPVYAVVGENGAFYMRYDRKARKMITHHWADLSSRQRNRAKLNLLSDEILKSIPGCALASDQAYREADLAIDFCEDVPPLSESEVSRIVDMFRQAGAHAKVSSIHVNGWFGDYDKLSMTRTLFAREFGCHLEDILDDALFIGDSPNDEPMFGFFSLSVGVANVHALIHRIQDKPAFVTTGHGGDGFAEMAARLLEACRQR